MYGLKCHYFKKVRKQVRQAFNLINLSQMEQKHGLKKKLTVIKFKKINVKSPEENKNV